MIFATSSIVTPITCKTILIFPNSFADRRRLSMTIVRTEHDRYFNEHDHNSNQIFTFLRQTPRPQNQSTIYLPRDRQRPPQSDLPACARKRTIKRGDAANKNDYG